MLQEFLHFEPKIIVKKEKKKNVNFEERCLIQPGNNNRKTQGQCGIAIHKLRETKWFGHNEINILCSVTETGFILEKKSVGSDVSDWGIAVWKKGKEKSKDPESIKVYALKTDKGNPKVKKYKLKEFWKDETMIRVNNKTDAERKSNTEEEIRFQIMAAKKIKRNWKNGMHFVYWCRYDKPEDMVKKKQMSDAIKWGSVGTNAGIMLIKTKTRRHTVSC